MTQLVIEPREGANVANIEALVGVPLKKNSPHSILHVADVDDDVVDKALNALNASPLVVSAEKNVKSFSIL